ncbi:hypothetical protein C8R47DRAFT_1211488 [Mycena vitilis]|nr:hypothetical protein C8R47DRAFT_1211488 [Mycena vitilis]
MSQSRRASILMEDPVDCTDPWSQQKFIARPRVHPTLGLVLEVFVGSAENALADYKLKDWKIRMQLLTGAKSVQDVQQRLQDPSTKDLGYQTRIEGISGLFATAPHLALPLSCELRHQPSGWPKVTFELTVWPKLAAVVTRGQFEIRCGEEQLPYKCIALRPQGVDNAVLAVYYDRKNETDQFLLAYINGRGEVYEEWGLVDAEIWELVSFKLRDLGEKELGDTPCTQVMLHRQLFPLFALGLYTALWLWNEPEPRPAH